MSRDPVTLLRLYLCARRAGRYAAAHGIPGMEFHRFGRRLGRRLLVNSWSPKLAYRYLVTPVEFVRYFEFSFALSCLPEAPGRCLDVSSPKLFNLYVASKSPDASILMINPDPRAASQSAAIIAKLKMTNLEVERRGVETLSPERESYDCIWSISVVEHIAGESGDRDALRLMYGCLNDGGRLILTVPVDRRFWEEYRDEDPYGTQPRHTDGRYFFQRFYDETAIRERLLSAIGEEPKFLRWFGETSPGRFNAYIDEWRRKGYERAVEGPKEIADHYREFRTWEEMPGIGVCGLMIEKAKPLSGERSARGRER